MPSVGAKRCALTGSVVAAAVIGGGKATERLHPMKTIGGHRPPLQEARRRLNFFLALYGDSWQKAFSLRVNKFIFNPADDGQENLGRQRNGGGQFDRLPIRCHFCRLRHRLET
ncbi:MAG: hypothetical protein DME44_05770 [Verrucomicrobia bacterium]|nr:MAG: hypothetical protein DME44_05770 [Verrucomicrobiota bacterium]